MHSKKSHVTIHDIAKELGISGSTVSRALNNHPRISEATKQAVLEIAEKYHYRPNTMAASLRKGEGNTVGLIIPNINRNFFSNVIWGIEDVLSSAGYNLMICQSNEKLEKEKSALSALMDARVEAILMSLSMETHDYDHIKNLLDRGVKMVFFDRIPTGLNVHSVVVNDYSASYNLTKEILKQGHKTPAYVGGSNEINIYHSRRQGFLDALKDAGIKINEASLIEEQMTKKGGQRAFHQLMKLPEKPDAIFCAGDFTALGVLLAAKDAGVKIPQDLVVSGFSNEDFTGYITPTLTSIDQRSIDMGRKVAEEFLNIENEKSNTNNTVTIEPRILFRESTGSVLMETP